MPSDDSLNWVLDHLPWGVWVAGTPDGQVVYSNRPFQEILGMNAVGDSVIEDAPRTYGIFDRTGRPYPVEGLPFSRALAAGQTITVDDIVIHRPDGSRVNVRATGSPVRAADGRITHVIVAFADNTREVEAELRRTTAEAHLGFVLEHAPIAIFSVDRHGIITLSEGAGLASLGVKSGELVGRSVFDLYKDHPTISGYIRRGLAGESFWYTVQVGEATYDTWLAPLRDAGGEIVGALGLSNDSTEVRRLQASIIQSDRVRAVGTLAASVAHEVNNPLMYVLGCLGTIERTLERQLATLAGTPDATALAAARGASVRMREELATARNGVERIATITRDLKTFSRDEDPKPQPVDLGVVVSAVLKLVRKEIEARARLRLALRPVPPVLGSEARLVQILLNLLLNAAQSLSGDTPERDLVTLALHAEGEAVVIEVGDTGPGVPPAERAHIFEPFVTTKPIGEGTGLGLFVCRNIVKGMNGEISVHDRPGGGALFRVSLPRATAEAETEALGARPSGPRPGTAAGGARILVIDDDPLVARSIASALEEAGFRVETESDALAALALLRSNRPFDLIYCDLMMKGLTGVEIAAALEGEHGERLLRMVFMTGGAFVPRAAAFVAAHRDQCVDKPFDAIAETRRRLSP